MNGFNARFHFCLLWVGLLMQGAMAGLGAQEPLTLRVNDAVAAPGDLMAVVLRTYAPRGLTQGQICLGGGGTRLRGEPVLTALEDYAVFDSTADTLFDITFDAATGTADLTFQSAAAGVNREDGPLAVLYFRVSASAVPGTVLEWTVDGGQSSLVDAGGQPVPIEPRAGSLEIVAAEAPVSVAVDSDETYPGGTVDLMISTERSLPLDHGLVELTYDAALFDPLTADNVTAWADPRYGLADTQVLLPEPGRLMLTFDAQGADFNRLPGDVLTLRLPVSPSAPVGSMWTVTPTASSFVVGLNGTSPSLALEAGRVDVGPSPEIFVDGFESGTLSAWIAVP